MDKKLKLLKMIMLVFVILIILVVIVMIVLNKRDEEGTSKPQEPTKFEQTPGYKVSEKIEKVKIPNKYYTVQQLTERYFTYINDSIYDDSDIKDLSQEALYNIIDKDYLDEFGISSESELIKKYEDFQEDEQAEVEDMYLVEKSGSDNIFLVYGTLKVSQQDFQLMVRIDGREMLFSIFPEEYMKKHNYSSDETKEDFDELFEKDLEKNEYNEFAYTTVSEQRMAFIYFNQIKNLLLDDDASKAYQILDEEYKNVRFKTEESFKKYLKNNKEELTGIQVKSYLTNYYEDYTEYVCRDQYKNIYVIKENAINDYTIELDDYSVSNEELDKKYMDLSIQEKVANNVNKWIKMLNNRDYEAAFNVLDETFRKNNFDNDENKFEEYMRYYFPDHYELELGEYSDETGVSQYEIVLSDITGEQEVNVATDIYMQLGEGTDFVMSFRII